MMRTKLKGIEGASLSKAVSGKNEAKGGPSKCLVEAVSLDFLALYRADAITRIRIVKIGLPARSLDVMAKYMAIPTARLVATLGLARTNVYRKARANRRLSKGDSARLLGMARLIGQVQEMVTESGDPDGFETASWVAQWLQSSLPALEGRCPAEFMDTVDGQSLVSTLVARMQTGTYS